LVWVTDRIGLGTTELDGRLHIAKLLLKQSLVWYHWFCYFINFVSIKWFLAFFKLLENAKNG